MNVRAIFVVALGCLTLGLSGCVTFNGARSVDGLERPGAEGISVEYKFYEKEGVVKKELPTLYSEFISAKANLSTNKVDKTLIAEFADAGIALSNKACSEWFELHNRQFENTNHHQSVTNLIGTTILSGMSFGKASVNAMGAVSLALGGANAGFEMFKKDHFLSGTIWKLRDGVAEGRVSAAKNLKDNIFKEDDPYNYYEVQDALREYHTTCARLSLIKYVESSVELARYTPNPVFKDTLSQADVFNLNKEVYKTLEGKDGVYTERQLGELYVIFFASDSEQAKTLLSLSHHAARKGTVDNLKDADAVKAAEFFSNLDQIGALLGFDKKLEAQRKKEAEAAAQVAEQEKDVANKELARESKELTRAKAELNRLKAAEDLIKRVPLSTGGGRKPITLQVVPKK